MQFHIDAEHLLFFEKLSLKLSGLTILHGKNASGKSSAVAAFEILHAVSNRNLQSWAKLQEPVSDVFYHGPNISSEISLTIKRGDESYKCILILTNSGTIVIKRERLHVHSRKYEGEFDTIEVKDESFESIFSVPLKEHEDVYEIISAIGNWWIGKLQLNAVRNPDSHDTGSILYPNCGNLLSYLLNLSNNSPQTFERLSESLRLVNSDFLSFVTIKNGSKTELFYESASRSVLSPLSYFSDGTLRFICYAAVFLLENPPELIVIDDIETGLDDSHLMVLMKLAKKASEKTSVLITTRSDKIAEEYPDCVNESIRI